MIRKAMFHVPFSRLMAAGKTSTDTRHTFLFTVIFPFLGWGGEM